MSNSIPSVPGIYTIRNTINGKFYIGQAKNLYKRWGVHKSELRGGYHDNGHLQKAWNKYGESAFQFFVLEYCEVGQLTGYEQEYLNIWVGQSNCYNIARDAEVPSRGLIFSEEVRAKLSRAHKGRIPPNKGIPMSDEQKQKLSEALSGEKNPWFGRKHSEKTKEKMRKAAMGKNNPFFGKTHSDEVKQEMRKRYRKLSPDQVALVRLLLSEGVSHNDIAGIVGTGTATVSYIRNGKLYKD